MVRVEGLGPDLVKVQLLETVSQPGPGGRRPEATTPDGARPDEEAELPAVRLVPMEVDVTDEAAFTDSAESIEI